MDVTASTQALAQGVVTAFGLVFIIPLIGEILKSLLENAFK